MLDELNEICKEYHLVAVGISGVICLFVFRIIFKDVVGRWKWNLKRKGRKRR